MSGGDRKFFDELLLLGDSKVGRALGELGSLSGSNVTYEFHTPGELIFDNKVHLPAKLTLSGEERKQIIGQDGIPFCIDVSGVQKIPLFPFLKSVTSKGRCVTFNEDELELKIFTADVISWFNDVYIGMHQLATFGLDD